MTYKLYDRAFHLKHGDFQGLCAQDCRQRAAVCDDSNACTTDTCNTGDGTCGHAAVSCNDANACTTDSCDTVTGCLNETVSCDDGSECSSGACNPSTGCANETVSCDDNNACTIDSCTNAQGCAHEAVACGAGQTCNATNGSCRTLPFALVQSYSTSCTPTNYKTLDVGESFTSFNAAFVSCALECEAIANCSQIFVGYQASPAKTGPYACLTGIDEAVDSNRGWNSAEIQCNLPSPPYPAFGEWYNRTQP